MRKAVYVAIKGWATAVLGCRWRRVLCGSPGLVSGCTSLSCRITVLLVCLLSGILPAGADDLKVGVSALPRSADPHFGASRIEQFLHSQVYEGLADTDERQQPVPRLAESWKRTADGAWLFHLRRNVRFQNGRPFTARDVIYSFCRTYAVTSGARPFAGMLSAVTAVEVPDPFTILLRLQGRGSVFPLAVATIPIVSAPPEPLNWQYRPGGCDGDTGSSRTDFADPALGAGTGPFRLAIYGDDHIVTVRNSDYWAEKPVWQRFELLRLPDRAKVRAMMDGRVDILDSPPPEALSFLKKTGTATLLSWPSSSLMYLQVNTRPRPGMPDFNDARVRRAIVLAIPRGILAQRVLNGTAVATGQMALKATGAYAPDIPDDEYDPAAARRLLVEAGYPDRFGITILTGEAQARVATAAAHFLADVGIDATVQVEPQGALMSRLSSGDFQIYCAGWIFTPSDIPGSFATLLGSRDTQAGQGAANYGGYANPDLDRILAAARTDGVGDQWDPLARELAETAYRDTAWIPLLGTQSRWMLRGGLVMQGRLDRSLRATQVRPILAEATGSATQ